MAEEINILKCLQEMRVELQDMGLTKSGHNDYSKYDYFLLSDFLPAIQKLALKNRIIPLYELENDIAMLHICSIDDKSNRVTFSIPTADATVKGANAMQSVGSLTSYTRRYLYMIAFEIAESNDYDSIEEPSVNQQPDFDVTANDLIDNAKIKTIRKQIEAKGLGDDSILKYYNIADFYDMTLSMWMDAMKLLDKYPDKSEE